jgi:hypothetical protein
MSDTFDHEGDAWASLDFGPDEDAPYGYTSNGARTMNPRRQVWKTPPRPSHEKDPLYHHEPLTFLSLHGQSPRAYLLEIYPGVYYWIPKTIARHVNFDRKTMYVHTKTWAMIREKGPAVLAVPDPGEVDTLIRSKLNT